MEVEAKLRACVRCKWNKSFYCKEESCGHHKVLEDLEVERIEQERIASKGW